MNVNKGGFVHQLMEKYHYTKASATSVVDDFCAVLLDNMERGNTVSFYGFGCFDIVERAARSCPNPRTQEKCEIPAHWVPRFYPGNAMRRSVKKWEDNEKRGVF